MRILLLTRTFNSLSQRLYVALAEAGHRLAVEYDIDDRTTIEAVSLFRPDLIVAPYLTRAIPEAVWRHHRCLIVHPGPPGDRGPNALDWAILDDAREWGVTVLEATGELDAGPVWAYRSFRMRNARKGSLYRFEVADAAAEAVLEAVASAGEPGLRPAPPIPRAGHGWRGAVPPSRRRIDWQSDDTESILRKLRSADGRPGIRDQLRGLPCRLFDACAEQRLRGHPGELIAWRGPAVCRATRDSAVWLGHLRPEAAGHPRLKLPATLALRDRIADVPEAPATATAPGYRDIGYNEYDGVGILDFDFYNGAMGTEACRRLLAAYRAACRRPTRVLLLRGGRDFWSNGLDLNRIEAAASPADESWANIQAMDDLAEAIITTTDRLTVAALGGNAGAGGVFLALAADRVVARAGSVLNPHYRNMGNLYGSEFWTYLLPGRLGAAGADELMQRRLPLGTPEAERLGLVDAVIAGAPDAFRARTLDLAREMVADRQLPRRLADKRARRARDEAAKPLADYRAEELAHMRLNFYGFDPSYHVARHRFVHKTPHAWTPRHLAVHRALGWQVPESGPGAA